MGSPAFDETTEPGWWRASAPTLAPLVVDEEYDFLDLRPAPTPAPIPALALADSDAASAADPREEEDDVLADPKREADLDLDANPVQ